MAAVFNNVFVYFREAKLEYPKWDFEYFFAKWMMGFRGFIQQVFVISGDVVHVTHNSEALRIEKITHNYNR